MEDGKTFQFQESFVFIYQYINKYGRTLDILNYIQLIFLDPSAILSHVNLGFFLRFIVLVITFLKGPFCSF